eukprot:CAMPEP_0118973554 /NCGR_PEP_ID=MMETSP1173-20130426/10423_1 /TAXON_ID=1034831 /ORGANISM="Rhizochromulina marina cf, Strain CCMP1243" /LENGTH=158 /DNA_ID=CAMNT_0006923231 /DNA_START=30 /DNA_END=506 /DNA_ORIENTATION=-
MSALCPDSLTWMVVKDFNSFQRKRNGTTRRTGTVTLSAEPGNLTNTNSYKYSGFNSKTIGFTVQETEGPSGPRVSLELELKNAKKTQKPSQSKHKVPLRFKNYARAEKCIASQTIDSHYRKDLINAAMSRWAKLHSARKVKEGTAKPMKKQPGRRSKA